MFGVLTLLLVIGSHGGVQNPNVCTTKDCEDVARRILSSMGPVHPCQDFYRFACGNFLKTAVIGPDQDRFNAFTVADELVKQQLRSVLVEKVEQEATPYRSMKMLFHMCLDEKRTNARGVTPALELLQKAGGWPVLNQGWSDQGWDFLETEIRLDNLLHGDGILFAVGVGIDFRNSSRRLIHVDQPPFGLAREYLVAGLEDQIVQNYYHYMVDMAVLFGADRRHASEKLLKSLHFEIALAKAATREEDRRDFTRMYNKIPLEMLIARMGWLKWTRLLDGIMPPTVTAITNEIVVMEPAYLEKLHSLLLTNPKEVIANFMMWRAVQDMAEALSAQVVHRKLEFERSVSGITSSKPRWEICLGVVSSKLFIALSSLYVKRFFEESSKLKALDMAERIRQEVFAVIQEVNWMDDRTKRQAIQKAEAITKLIGYPVELLDIDKLNAHYSSLRITSDNYLEAMIEVERYIAEFAWNRLNQPVQKNDWVEHGKVIDINAYYDHTENAIEFPAAILQPPFFHAQVPWYVNYGAIGTVIGHEITHGFDDKGRQFNYKGELVEWWDDAVKKKFEQQKQCIVNQYGAFNDSHNTRLLLNGVNTQGENIADNGGLKIAFRAYRKLSAQLGAPEQELPGLPGFSQAQLFLMSQANLWCSKARLEKLRDEIKTGVHAPSEFRVNGMMMNFPEFSEIFKCKPGDPMNPLIKCHVW